MAPDTTRRPPSSITTWSHTCCTSSSRWVASSTEMPRPPRRATRSSISSRPIGSRPAVGSSSSTSSGSATIAWASLVRWRMPVEKPADGSEAGLVEPDEVEHVRRLAGGRPGAGGRSARRRWRRCRPRSGRAGGSRAPACSRAGCARRSGRAATSIAAHLEAPLGGVAQPEHHPEEGRLAGAVGPDEADAPGGDVEIEPVDGRDAGVALGQSPRPEESGGGVHGASLPGGMSPSARRGSRLGPRTGKSVGLACNADR